LDYFGGRYYDPETGRWLTPDPLGFVDGLNPYLYVGNNPINLIDPFGFCAEPDNLTSLFLGVLATGSELAYEVYLGAQQLDNLLSNSGADTPVGRSGSPLDVTPGTNSPTTIDGIDYSGHALDQMQGRGFTPSVVEDTINNGQQFPTKDPDTVVYYNSSNNVSVYVGKSSGKVVTVRNGTPN
jgi:uncharacterized protein RhaS with RHS repeats